MSEAKRPRVNLVPHTMELGPQLQIGKHTYEISPTTAGYMASILTNYLQWWHQTRTGPSFCLKGDE